MKRGNKQTKMQLQRKHWVWWISIVCRICDKNIQSYEFRASTLSLHHLYLPLFLVLVIDMASLCLFRVFSVCDNIFNDGVELTWHPGLHLPVPLCLIIAEIMLNNDSCYSPYTGCPLQATRRNCGEQLTHKQHPPLEQTLPQCPNHKCPFKQIFNSQSLINIFTMFTQYTK